MNTLKRKVLELIENDARLTPEKIAVMLDKDTASIKALIEEMEIDGTIHDLFSIAKEMISGAI